jgi:hypothetical protein
MGKSDLNIEIKNALDVFLLQIPLVTAGQMFGYPAYFVNKKMFACVYQDGVGLKVPQQDAESLIGRNMIAYFQPMGRKKMREWIQIHRRHPGDYMEDMALFETSLNFVASLDK